MSGTEDQSWVTLATNDSYALGALVVARSLKRVNTTKKLTVMITPGVTGPMRDALRSEFDVISEVNVLDSEDAANLALLTRPELGITFTKLHCWRLTQYSKCVFLDADTLILQNCDELFDREEFSAAPDVGWPDCFNSGVFVFKPSDETFNRLLSFAVTGGSFDGGDQGLLNLYFNDWSVSDISRHLPFTYNMVASATYSYLPAFRVFGANVKIAHFIGTEKPWLMFFDTATGSVRAPSGQEHLTELLQAWWDIFRADVHRKLSPDMGGDSSQSATVVEQVQDSFSHIYIPTDPEVSSESPFSPYYQYQPPPPSHPDPIPELLNPHKEQYSGEEFYEKPKPPPEFHWASVALERFTPEYIVNPPPPPSPPPVFEHLQETHDHHEAPNTHPSPPSPPSPSSVHVSAEPPVHKSESLVETDGQSSSAGLAGVFAQMSLEGEKSSQLIEAEAQMRKHAWESGHIDYMGKDSFDNILKKLQASMAQTVASPTDAPPVPRPKSKSPSPPKSAPPASEPAPQPAPVAQPAPEQPTAPVVEPVIQPVASAAPTAQQPPPAAAPPTADSKEAEERAALEKKLAEQMLVAEQKLREEKLASEARAAVEISAAEVAAANAAAVAAAVAATASQAAQEPPPTNAGATAVPAAPPVTPPEDAPVAPPRRQSKVTAGGEGGGARVVWRNVGYRVGLGLSCIAIAAYAIYNASASATFPLGESSESSSDNLNNPS